MPDKHPDNVGDVVDVDRNPTGQKRDVARGKVVQPGYRESWSYRDMTVVREAKRRAAS